MTEENENNYLVRLTYVVWVQAKNQEEAKVKAEKIDQSKLDLVTSEVAYGVKAI